MVAQVGREVDVNSRGARGFERAISSAAQHGHAPHRSAFVATDEEAGGARRQNGGDVVGEGTERGLVDGTDTTQADLVSLGVRAARLQRRGIAQADQVGERRRDAVAGHIRVGVRVEQGDA